MNRKALAIRLPACKSGLVNLVRFFVVVAVLLGAGCSPEPVAESPERPPPPAVREPPPPASTAKTEPLLATRGTEKAPEKPTVALHFVGSAHSDYRDAIFIAISDACEDYQFLQVEAAGVFDHPGFIEVELTPTYVFYETKSSLSDLPRLEQIDNGMDIRIVAFADWPTTFDQARKLSVHLVAEDRIRVQYTYLSGSDPSETSDEIERRKARSAEIATLTRLSRERASNRDYITDQLSKQLGQLPAFARIDATE